MSTKYVKITDQEVLNTIKLKDLVVPVKKFVTEQEKEEYNSIKDEYQRRLKAIELYNKYIDAVIASQEAPKDEVTTGTVNEGQEPPEPTRKRPTPIKEAKVDKTTVKSTAKATALGITDFLQVEIRDVPGFNGKYMKEVDQLLTLVFRNPTANIKFSNVSTTKSFISLVESVTKVKGVFSITEQRRFAIVTNIKANNGLK
jgi:hypothetical protein